MPLSYKHEDVLREIACTELRMDRRDAALMALDRIEKLERCIVDLTAILADKTLTEDELREITRVQRVRVNG